MNLPNPMCSNCHLRPEHTAHLMYHCQVARSIWAKINEIVNECLQKNRNNFTPILMSMDNVLYNYPPQHLKTGEREDLVDIIMLTKHILYRLKFRDDIDTLPSVRRILIILAIELNKAKTVRNFMNKSSAVFTNCAEMINNEAGF